MLWCFFFFFLAGLCGIFQQFWQQIANLKILGTCILPKVAGQNLNLNRLRWARFDFFFFFPAKNNLKQALSNMIWQIKVTQYVLKNIFHFLYCFSLVRFKVVIFLYTVFYKSKLNLSMTLHSNTWTDRFVKKFYIAKLTHFGEADRKSVV